MVSFSDLALSIEILKAVDDVGHKIPTPIQIQAIPPIMQGRDVLGIAQTGTGKTAGFILPMIQRLMQGRARARMPRSLILVPTWELAQQISKDFQLYSKYTNLNMALIIGGVSFDQQNKCIDRGVDILIATPGRLLDHFKRGKLLLTHIEILVMDEADRMLDMGFIPDVKKIFKRMPFNKQTLFFSATMAAEIDRISQEFLQNPVRIKIKKQLVNTDAIIQKLCPLQTDNSKNNARNKRALLLNLIKNEDANLTNGIVFCNRKADIKTVFNALKRHGHKVASLHGDLKQHNRTQTLEQLHENKIRLLVASDVAARGLDIPTVSHIFNYDVPTYSENYVHRIGRTGRAGRKGWAFMLYLPHEKKYLTKIEKLLGESIPKNDLYIAKIKNKTQPTPTKNIKKKPKKINRQKNLTHSHSVQGMGDHIPAFLMNEIS